MQLLQLLFDWIELDCQFIITNERRVFWTCNHNHSISINIVLIVQFLQFSSCKRREIVNRLCNVLIIWLLILNSIYVWIHFLFHWVKCQLIIRILNFLVSETNLVSIHELMDHWNYFISRCKSSLSWQFIFSKVNQVVQIQLLLNLLESQVKVHIIWEVFFHHLIHLVVFLPNF